MDYRPQISTHLLIENHLVGKTSRTEVQTMIEQALHPVKSEDELLREQNEKLQKRIEELKAALKAKEEKYGTVRMQFQGLYILTDLNFIKESKAPKQNMAPALSILFNRFKQSPRDRLSSINRLFYSPKKSEQKDIYYEVDTWIKLFEQAGFKEAAQRAKDARDNPSKYSQIL